MSPYFPPSTLAGVHRARHLAKHLPSHGWRPIVVRVDEARYAESPDPDLAALVPASVEQVRTGALPAALCRPFGFGDIGLRAFLDLGRAIRRLVETEKPGVILITGSPYYPMLLAGQVRRRFGVPVILDFQDPWVSAHGATLPMWSKAGIAHRLATMLEPRALRGSSYVTSVSETQNDEMAARYAWMDRSRMAAIPIGGDPTDFEALRGRAETTERAPLAPDRINLSYVGTFLPRAEPLARRLFRSVAALRRSAPQLAARLRLNFVGTSNQPDGARDLLVTPIAAQEGVADLVRESPQRTPFLEALRILANSDGLLLIGSDEPHYTASKIYPALMSGRPYLSLFHSRSSAHSILSAAGGGYAFSFDDPASLASLGPIIAQALGALIEAPGQVGRADPAAYSAFTASAVAGQFAAIFDHLAAGR